MAGSSQLIKSRFISFLRLKVLLLAAIIITGCGGGGPEHPGPEPTYDILYSKLDSTPDWSAQTHGKLGASEISANIPAIFDTTRVQKITIVIENQNWEEMGKNFDYLKALYRWSNKFPEADPIYIPATVKANGLEWYKVAVRYKGNSTLYLPENGKLPFKLKFNEFEDLYPQITGQRFYGFKTLHLKNNFTDYSMVREVTTGDLMRDFGVAVSHASFWEVYVDIGDGQGEQYFGLYTMVEDVEDTVLKTQFSSSSGNLYKPEGPAATFAEGTDDTAGYSLKNNEEEATYADILELYGILNDISQYSDQRSDWKADLEYIFEVDAFLKWLAVNTVIQNFDAYGVMPQNYYLYNNPSTGKLQWIPWDHNGALKYNASCPPLNHSDSSLAYPLIHLLLGDPDYYRSYAQYVRDFAQNYFQISELAPLLEEYRALLAPSVAAERPGYTHTSPAQFESEITGLESHITLRSETASVLGDERNSP